MPCIAPVVEKRARLQRRPGPARTEPEGTFHAVSLTTIVMFALGYAAVLIVVLSMLAAARRADERVHEEQEAILRSMSGDPGGRQRPGVDRDHTFSLLRHSG